MSSGLSCRPSVRKDSTAVIIMSTLSHSTASPITHCHRKQIRPTSSALLLYARRAAITSSSTRATARVSARSQCTSTSAPPRIATNRTSIFPTIRGPILPNLQSPPQNYSPKPILIGPSLTGSSPKSQLSASPWIASSSNLLPSGFKPDSHSCLLSRQWRRGGKAS